MSIWEQAMSYFPPVQSRRFREPDHPVLCRRIRCGVWPRGLGGYRPVVDDPTPHRRLFLHHLERFLRAQERPSKVCINYRLPLIVGQVFQRAPGGPYPGIVEQHVQPPECLFCPCEQPPHRFRISHVCSHHDGILTLFCCLVPRLLQQFRSSSCQPPPTTHPSAVPAHSSSRFPSLHP